LDRGIRPQKHIGVIGAGLAGLRCADVLLQHGFRVTILEGRRRIGGRLYQEKLSNGHWADMGPNWIHGTQNNPIFEIAKETGTVVDSWPTRSRIFDQHGVPFPLEQGEAYSTKMWNIVEEAFKHSSKNSKEIDANESLYDFFEQRIPSVIPETHTDFAMHREILRQKAEFWGAFVGGSIKKQSLRFCWLEECLEGGAFSSTIAGR
jgi:phytoene dehydrogenase-like protein